MASFPKDKPGYPYHRVVFRKTYTLEDGTKDKKRKTFYFRKKEWTRTQVTEWKIGQEAAFKKGWKPWNEESLITRKKSASVKQAIKSYEKIARRQLATSTLERRMGYLWDFAKHIGQNRAISTLGEEAINEWINRRAHQSKGKSSEVKYLTRKKRKTCVKALFEHAVRRMNAREEMPRLEVLSTRAERLQARNSNKFKDWLRSDELEEVINKLHALDKEIKGKTQAHNRNAQKYNRLRPDLQHAFRLVHKTGMRLGDLHAFSLDWIRPSPNIEGKRIIHFGATGEAPKSQNLNEAIPVMPEITEVIDALLKKGKQRPFGEMSKEWISKTFKACLKKAYPQRARRMSFRNLRDSAANYWLYERELPVKIVQQILRHKDIETTMIYVHDDLEEVEKQVWNQG